IPFENILDNDCIEYEELNFGQHAARDPKEFYISLARTVLLSAKSYVDTERYYSSEIENVVTEIRGDSDFILGRFTMEQALEIIETIAPSLAELPREHVWQRIKTALGIELAGRLIGRKPQIGRIIRAILRDAAGPVSIAFLVDKLRVILGM